jgi:hypothetical protein
VLRWPRYNLTMNDISVRMDIRGQSIELDGCVKAIEEGGRPTWELQSGTRVKKRPAGNLTLVFASGSQGLRELSKRAQDDEGQLLIGIITVIQRSKTTVTVHAP